MRMAIFCLLDDMLHAPFRKYVLKIITQEQKK